jgi:hypothetical protein
MQLQLETTTTRTTWCYKATVKKKKQLIRAAEKE